MATQKKRVWKGEDVHTIWTLAHVKWNDEWEYWSVRYLKNSKCFTSGKWYASKDDFTYDFKEATAIYDPDTAKLLAKVTGCVALKISTHASLA